jgi:hypothetical protein
MMKRFERLKYRREKQIFTRAIKTAVSETGRKNCISGTATSASPNPVNPRTREAMKIINESAIISFAGSMSFGIELNSPEFFSEFLY